MAGAGLSYATAGLLGYALGSIPFGLLLTRFAGTTDIRTIGSGNIGATNVLRTGRKDLAAATLLCDALKGTAAVLIAASFAGERAGLAAAVGAFLGHLYPVWLRFRGGKGVATYLGCLYGSWWPMGLIFSLLWLATAFTLRFSSASALVASALTPILFFLLGRPAEGMVFLALTLILWWKHRANLARLLSGTEAKIGQKT